MGVDTLIRLPADVRIRDVSIVIGILAGLKPEQHSLCGSSYSCSVAGVETKSSSIPECADIEINGDLVDGEKNHHVMFHFEYKASRLLMPRSTAFWIAVGRRLIQFFGGSMDYQDCDSVETNYRRKSPRKDNSPEGGKPWHDLQDAMLAIKPITKDELIKCDKWAAYRLDGSR